LEKIHADLRGTAGDSTLRLADFDLLLSDAFMLLATHLAAGAVEPAMVESEWFIQVIRPDAAEVLRRALNMSDVTGALDALRPARPEYAGLRRALRDCTEAIARGGWPSVPAGPTIRPGDVGPRVLALRERLNASGDMAAVSAAAGPAAGDVYDGEVAAAVRRYQTRLGFGQDGIAGAETVNSLNTPAEERLAQIKANLERWRWLPRDLGRRYIMVNAASFHLDLVEDGKVVLDMRVVVGAAATRTPVFDDVMTTIEINPYWDVPDSIASKEILVIARRDPDYFRRGNYKLYAGWGRGAAEVNPAAVDWAAVKASNFPYHIRQMPGPANSLGQLAFRFPNPWSIYLHDTPQRELFQQSSRSFSHGCIRIAWPLDLAAALLRDDPEWTKENIQAAIAKGANKVISIPNPIPIYIVYLTAWHDEKGAVNFRKDFYGRDAVLLKALEGEIRPAFAPATGR
jgi:murein L,D-transpeptidase YcbB/YkuD